VASTPWLVVSPFAREHYGRGFAEGYAEERAKAEAARILRILAVRGVEVPDDVRARILGCADIHRLVAWFDRALEASSVADLFE
jgi:hypothetical protein